MTTQPRETGLARSYFSWGWLLVAALPFSQVIGRAAFNILGVVLLAWGLIGMASERRLPRGPLPIIYLLMLASFTVSALLARDPQAAFAVMRNFVLYSLLCWPVMTAIRTDRDLQRLLDAFAACGAITIVTLWIIYLLRFRSPGFIPEQHMREDNVPLLLPFLVGYLLHRSTSRFRTVLTSFFVLAAVAYVILSNGRAALFGLIAGMATFAILVLRTRMLNIMLLSVAVVLFAWAIRGAHLYRDATQGGDLSHTLNRVSSFRLELWRNAVDHPPANLLLGSGMGNIPDVVLTVNGAAAPNLKHLHNFLLDCGYENGLLGLTLLLLFIGVGLYQTLRRWRAGGTAGICYGTLLAASVAILTSSLLSFSYSSRQFAIYLFLFVQAANALRHRMTNTLTM